MKNIKNIKNILVAVTLLTVSFSYAQFDVALNPLGALFGRPGVSAEYVVSDNIGVELEVSTAFGKAAGISVDGYNPKQSGFGLKLQGKYYFSPDEGADGIYLSLYVRQKSLKIEDKSSTDYQGFKSSILAAGLTVGKKWIFDNSLFVETAFGAGRAFSEKYEWLDSSNTATDYGVNLGVDFVARLAIGYRFN